ncbi:acyl-CoA N-acyltransferase [Schizophyllum commune]
MEIILYDHAQHEHLLPAFGEIHVACMKHDNLCATILTYDTAKATALYRGFAEESVAGRRNMWFARAPVEEGGEPEVVGFVSLEKSQAETGSFRGDVQKLIVSPRYRKKGVARALLDKVEKLAEAEGRTILTLSTEIGNPAEHVYRRLGWISYGVIPRFTISPSPSHELLDEVFFYKMLPSHGTNVKLPPA